MDPQKEALKRFLRNARNILERHLKSVNGAKEMLNTYDDRSKIILNIYNREIAKAEQGQKGGSIQQQLQTVKQYNPQKIQQDIDKLLQFQPKDALPNSVKPIVDEHIAIFIPEVRDKVRQVVGSFFILGALEKLPIFGPLVAAAMDVATAYLPALATTVQNIMPNIVGLFPLPYAAFAGEAAGYAMASVLFFLTMMTQASRGDFIEAAEASAGLVPVIGTTLTTYADKGTQLYEKYEGRREEILQSIVEIQALTTFLLANPAFQQQMKPFIPLVNILLEEAQKYKDIPTNFVINTLKPISAVVKNRLNGRFPTGGFRRRHTCQKQGACQKQGTQKRGKKGKKRGITRK